MRLKTLVVYPSNLIDITYTGAYQWIQLCSFTLLMSILMITGTVLMFWYLDTGPRLIRSCPFGEILPLSDGISFEIENSRDIGVREFMISQNVYRAVLEVYVSFHENDEFWHGNVPNDLTLPRIIWPILLEMNSNSYLFLPIYVLCSVFCWKFCVRQSLYSILLEICSVLPII